MSRNLTTIRRIAFAAIALTAVTACQDDGPVEPLRGPTSEVAALPPIKNRPTFYFNGILFAGTHDTPKGELYTVNPDGSGLVRVTNDTLGDTYPDVSPAGPAFTWARFSPDGQTSEIYSQNFDGTKRKQLTFLNSVAISPRFSPDGKRIAFTGVVPGVGAEIFTMNADGTGLVRLTFSAKNSGSPSWSPDGSKIAFQSAGNNGFAGVWVMDASGSNQKLLTSCGAPSGCTHPKWSPVANEIAIERADGSGIFVVDATSGGTIAWIPPSPLHYDILPTWSKDGGRIVFSSLRGNNGTYDLFETKPMRRDMTVPPPVVRLTSLLGEEMSAAYSR